MKSLRILSSAALALILAFAISACQKSQTDMSQTSDTTQVSQGYGSEQAPPDQASPEAQPGAQGATLPDAEKPAPRPRTKAPKAPSTSAT